MPDHLHIICLDAPSPPNYGGAFDLYYKIPSLARAGKKIILHYFAYKDYRNAEGLSPYCDKIYTYDRGSLLKSLVARKPYIVASRTNSDLIHRLNADDYPVLLEGIHCTGIIPYLSRQKKIFVRVHNDEANYYHGLATMESNLFTKLYFFYESALLKTYQKTLPQYAEYFFVSTIDQQAFKKEHSLEGEFLPCFLPWQRITSKTGKGSYCLYQGNLSVSENFEAVTWLIQNVFSKLDIALIIAGNNAERFRDITRRNSLIQLIPNPSDEKLEDLIQNAHINVLPSSNKTGVKLKLLHALFAGRFCIANYVGFAGSGVENHVMQAESIEDWINLIEKIRSTEFTVEMVEERKQILSIYDNDLSAQKLIEVL